MRLCPKCNGSAVRQVDVSLWKCETRRTQELYLPGPDPRDPRRGLVEYQEVRCNYTWHDPEGDIVGAGRLSCRCGTFAAGHCTRCLRPVCVIHSAIVDAQRRCRKTDSELAADSIRADREIEAQAERWLSKRSDPAFMDRLYSGMVHHLCRIGRAPDAVVEFVHIGPTRRNWRGHTVAPITDAGKMCEGWLAYESPVPDRSTEDSRGYGYSYTARKEIRRVILGRDCGWWQMIITMCKPSKGHEFTYINTSNLREAKRPDQYLHDDSARFMLKIGLTPKSIGLGDEWPRVPLLGSANHPESQFGRVHESQKRSDVPGDCITVAGPPS